MRIPLDYYRILGLPIQATAEQLQQAYRDRALQLPRREYAEITIGARKQLLDEAYAILSDSEQRSAYDASFLAKNYESESNSGRETDTTTNTDLDSYTPSVEIKSEQFVGALLILQELGEYELVLKLGRPYLSSGRISLERGRLGSPQLVQPDIVLTVALACLELGREQWQQGQYENAAASLETGQELLLREGLFAALRGEIQSDLYKLRPYRILELLALPEENYPERRHGLQLLRDMLQERGGIDGTGDDQSGLNIDDFLRFIQQLRSYLTSAEQQALFEAEARRPSAVATYLAVYALLARGFDQRQPALIRQAKQMLMRLGRRQDVHLEQAVCALLLGQTEEASRALELSQEYEPIAFIREHSQGAPDLLPGLCLYGERWLQVEVFPHFRDLREQRASLKDFFAEEQVQAYLEELPAEEEVTNEWAVLQTEQVPVTTATRSRGVSDPPGVPRSSVAWNAPGATVSPASVRQSQSREASAEAGLRGSKVTVEQQPAAARNATMTATMERPGVTVVSTLPTAERVSQESSETERNDTGFPGDGSKRQRRGQRGKDQSRASLSTGPGRGDSAAKASSGEGELAARRPVSGLQRSTTQSKSRRLILLALAGFLGVGALLMLLFTTYGWVQKSFFSKPSFQGERTLIQLTQPVVPIPEPDSLLVAPEGPLNEEMAKQVVQVWLATKTAALGSQHEIEQLQQILTEPALPRWTKRSQIIRRNNSHWQYKHSVEVSAVETNEAKPDQAKVDAQVSETAEFYAKGQLDKGSSYDENLRVRYDLVRKGNQWLIKDMTVLK